MRTPPGHPILHGRRRSGRVAPWLWLVLVLAACAPESAVVAPDGADRPEDAPGGERSTPLVAGPSDPPPRTEEVSPWSLFHVLSISPPDSRGVRSVRIDQPDAPHDPLPVDRAEWPVIPAADLVGYWSDSEGRRVLTGDHEHAPGHGSWLIVITTTLGMAGGKVRIGIPGMSSGDWDGVLLLEPGEGSALLTMGWDLRVRFRILDVR